ncbi:MAG: M48 family metalloprotease [Pyrinomonadaceae bacterium]
MIKRRIAAILLSALSLFALLSCGGLLNQPGSGDSSSGGQPAPHFQPGFNLFKPEQDVEMGRASAQEVAQQVPILRDEAVVGYVRGLGAKLAAKAPGFRFPYQFNVVASRDINAFALPGGFIFVNAGAIAAAKNEGELAGVIAHEITHVALRHGTNQASKAYIAKAGIGILGTLAGARSNPDIAQVINSVGGVGANALFLKFGRTAESQADLEGARIMAESGYDPRDMANFFKTLQAQGGQRAPEFLSDHPDPGNRIAAITKELPRLRVSAKPTHDTNAFEQAKARLKGGGSTAQSLASSKEPVRKGPRDPNSNEAGARPAPPSASLRDFQAQSGSFAFKYPQNWDAVSSDESNMIFAPKGAYGQHDQAVFVTHGIFVGALRTQSSDLQAATAALVEQQIASNPDFRVVRRPQTVSISGRTGYATVVAGPSTVTGVVEVDVIYTTATSDGRLFYLVTIVPEDEVKTYQQTFEQIIGSLRLAR